MTPGRFVGPLGVTGPPTTKGIQMAPEEILTILKQQFPADVTELVPDGPHPHAVVLPQRWREIALFLRDDPRLRFDWLRCISGVDHLKDSVFTLVYDLHATQAPEQPAGAWQARGEIAIKINIPRDNPHIATVSDVWPAAEWHEREAFDLLGIIFDGHPDPRRILCPDDWAGHPLRKDYEFPREYHGIPANVEPEQATEARG
jgi:NADH-quinone oxidoreductase subunit C